MQQRKGKGGAGVQIRVSVKPQQWRTLSLLSSLVLCVNSNPSRRILVKKTNSHMEKQSTGYLCSFLTAWLGNGKAFRPSGSTFRARLEINPGIIHVERLNAEEKKPCMFSKPDIPSGFTVISLHFEIFSPWTEGFVYLLHSLGILWEYLKGRSVSVQVLIYLTAGELLLYLAGWDHKQEATV